jgi:tetratricopeptide (TPR) repeat protein
MVNLAAIHLDTGRTQDAEAMLVRVLELNQQSKSPNAQLGMIAQNNLAIARLRLGKTAEALKTWEGLLVFQRKYIGGDHPNTLGTLNNLASAHEMLDQDAEAEKYYREALATKRRILPAGHQSLIRSIQNLGQHLAAKDQLEEASALLDEAMELCRKHLGNEHDLTYSVMLRVSRLRIKQKQIDEAISLGAEVRQGYGKLYGETDARAVQATMLLLLSYLDTGRYAEGAALWREIESKGYIADQTADTRIKLYSAAAGLLDGTGDRAAALVWFEKAKALEKAPGVASDGVSRFKKVAARFEATTRPG